MRIFVAGATGVLGQRTVALLIQAGHAVTGISRGPDKQALLESLGATPATVDIFDRAALARAVDGHDAVFNLATHIPSFSRAGLPGSWSENNRIRKEGSLNLTEAAIGALAGLYVQESITFPYPDRGTQWIDEETSFEPVAIARSVVAAESQARRFTAAGRTGIVLRFGQLYAPDSTHTVSTVKAAKRGMATTLGSRDAYMSSIHADDAAGAVAQTLGLAPGTYNVVDDEPLTRRDNNDALAAALDVRPPRLAPSLLARLGGSRARLMARSHRVSNKRLRDATDWKPRYPSTREGWPAVVAQLGAAEAER